MSSVVMDSLDASVLVLGGSGFLGSHLVDLLTSRGAKVRILDRLECSCWLSSEIEFLKGDILNYSLLLKAMKGIDVVFHTASLTDPHRSNADLFKVNVEGTKNVIAACLASCVKKLVYTSTSAVAIDGTEIKVI
jgi:nucleoside-diphosphate-sugar epimerase